MVTANEYLDELVGMAVAYIELAGGVELRFRRQVSDPPYILRVESACRVARAGTVYRISALADDADSKPGVAAIGSQLGETVRSAYLDNTDTLQIAFSGGVSMSVPPDEHYEAWTLTGPHSVLVAPFTVPREL